MVDKMYYDDRIKKAEDEIAKIDKELARIQKEVQKAQNYAQQIVNRKVALTGKIEGFKEVLAELDKEEPVEEKDGLAKGLAKTAEEEKVSKKKGR